MLAGLRFLGESPTVLQWVHHDLKPRNMVVDETLAWQPLDIVHDAPIALVSIFGESSRSFRSLLSLKSPFRRSETILLVVVYSWILLVNLLRAWVSKKHIISPPKNIFGLKNNILGSKKQYYS